MTLTIHHMQVSQSERLLWLVEELNIPYTLKMHQRAPVFSPQSIKDLHPMGQAPIIQDGPITLAESGACTEYILTKYGGGKLTLPPSHPSYPDYLYWLHFANGSLQPALLRLMAVKSAVGTETEAPIAKRSDEGMQKILGLMDERLNERSWLAGEEFTAADIMTVFTLTTMRSFYPLDLSEYGNLLGYLRRVSEREGYRRARARGDPQLELMIEGKPPRQFVEKLKAEGKL